jgi:hypothetical protein
MIFLILMAIHSIEVSDFGIDKCEDVIKHFKEVSEEEVTSMNKYMLHFFSSRDK